MRWRGIIVEKTGTMIVAKHLGVRGENRQSPENEKKKFHKYEKALLSFELGCAARKKKGNNVQGD